MTHTVASMTLGQLVQGLRMAHRLGQPDVAAYLDVPVYVVDQYERDARTPTEAELRRLGRLFAEVMPVHYDGDLLRELITRALAAAADE